MMNHEKKMISHIVIFVVGYDMIIVGLASAHPKKIFDLLEQDKKIM